MVTFLFGAGASIPFFKHNLTTASITERVLDGGIWNRIVEKYKQIVEPERIIPEAKDICSVLNLIMELRPNANFEEIAEILDKVSSWGFDSMPSDNLFNSIILIICGGKSPNTCAANCSWGIVPFLFRQIIADYICDIQQHHKSENYSELTSLQNKFLIDVCSKYDSSSIMSLNYDECIIISAELAGFNACFYNDDRMGGKRLNVQQFMTSKKVVYFPHGHTRFIYTSDLDVIYFPNSLQANEERWKRIESHMVGQQLKMLPGKFANNFNTFITTGQTKDDAMNNAPYCYYYHRFSIDVFSSEVVFVIGYSFADEHINRTLAAFLQIDKRRRVVIVDYYPYSVTRTDEYRDQSNILTKIKFCFKRVWDFYSSFNEEYVLTNQAEIEKINSIGYGFVFDQVLFYKNGYERFLKEYPSVMEYIL